MQAPAWSGFKTGSWCEEVDVRDFIQRNYVPYTSTGGFLKSPTPRTTSLWSKICELLWHEHERGGVFDVDTHTVASITAHGPGYID